MLARPIDEQAPLLANADPPAESQAGSVELSGSLQERRTCTCWSVAWFTVLAILVVCVLLVFIKGVIDSDDVEFDLGNTFRSALHGGLSGAAAVVLQVPVLMPLRTIMNYQYRYGTSLSQASTTLYADGGWMRFYHGLAAALVQVPMSRFGDTAANVGVLAVLKGNRFLKDLPALVKTIFASLAAAGFRMLLTPVDTIKTT